MRHAVILTGIAGAIAALYFVPSLVAYARALPGTRAIAAANAAWGWTLIGWAQALRKALAPRPPSSPVCAAPPGARSWQAPVHRGDLAAPARQGTPPRLRSLPGGLPRSHRGPAPQGGPRR
jgi:hypothetical protein